MPPEEPPAAAPADEVEPEEEREPAYSGGMADFADTAMLLRELSSLGLEDDGPSAPTAPTTPRAPAPRPGGSGGGGGSAAGAGKGKRKGIFGR